MKRLSILLAVSFALQANVKGEVESHIHNLCKDTNDYMGCVKANSKNNSWNPFNKKNISNDFKELNIYGFKYVQGNDGRIFIMGILKGSAADIAGLQYGDHITHINGQRLDGSVESKTSLTKGLNESKAKLKIIRYFRIENREYPGEVEKEFELNKEKFKITKNEWNNFLQPDPKKELTKWNNFYRNLYVEFFLHKGRKYYASEVCPLEKNMVWSFSGFFGRNVQELGCMTPEETKYAEMQMEIKKLKRRIFVNSLNNFSNSINTLKNQQQINSNTYNLGY